MRNSTRTALVNVLIHPTATACTARLVTLGIVACAVLFGASAAAQSSATRSVKEGVYSAKQAERGGQEDQPADELVGPEHPGERPVLERVEQVPLVPEGPQASGHRADLAPILAH